MRPAERVEVLEQPQVRLHIDLGGVWIEEGVRPRLRGNDFTTRILNRLETKTFRERRALFRYGARLRRRGKSKHHTLKTLLGRRSAIPREDIVEFVNHLCGPYGKEVVCLVRSGSLINMGWTTRHVSAKALALYEMTRMLKVVLNYEPVLIVPRHIFTDFNIAEDEKTVDAVLSELMNDLGLMRVNLHQGRPIEIQRIVPIPCPPKIL